MYPGSGQLMRQTVHLDISVVDRLKTLHPDTAETSVLCRHAMKVLLAESEKLAKPKTPRKRKTKKEAKQ